MDKRWCEHIRYSKNDSEYQGDWILNDKHGTFIDHKDNYVISPWICCPICGTPRPVEKKVELPLKVMYLTGDELPIVCEQFNQLIDYLKSEPWKK